MRATNSLYYIITTMDGVPVLDAQGEIVQYHSTFSMRETAKHLTFTTKQRHHTRGLTKDRRHKAKKHHAEHGFIPVGLLS